MPRFIRITHYEGARAIPFHVLLDINEVALISVPVSDSFPKEPCLVRLKSGHFLSVGPEDKERIEKAIEERDAERIGKARSFRPGFAKEVGEAADMVWDIGKRLQAALGGDYTALAREAKQIATSLHALRRELEAQPEIEKRESQP